MRKTIILISFLAVLFAASMMISTVSALPSTANLSIDKNVGWTNQPILKLTLSSTGASKMRLSCDGSNWTSTLSYFSAYDWNLQIEKYGCNANDANKSIYVQFSDDSVNWTSSVVDYVKLDKTPPTVPGNLIAIQSKGFVTLNWTESVESADGRGFWKYKIYRSKEQKTPRSYTLYWEYYSPQWKDPIPLADFYAYGVSAVDVLGNESAKAEILVEADIGGPVYYINFKNQNEVYSKKYVKGGSQTVLLRSDEIISADKIQATLTLPSGLKKTLAFSGSNQDFLTEVDLGTENGNFKIDSNATDLAGNPSTRSFDFVLDSIAPILLVESPEDGASISDVFKVKAKCADAVKLQIFIRNVDLLSQEFLLKEFGLSDKNINGFFEMDFNALNIQLPDVNFISGNYEIKVKALDAAQNESTASKNIVFFNEAKELLNIQTLQQEIEMLKVNVEKVLNEKLFAFDIPAEVNRQKALADQSLTAGRVFLTGNQVMEAKESFLVAKENYDLVWHALNNGAFSSQRPKITVDQLIIHPIFLLLVSIILIVIFAARHSFKTLVREKQFKYQSKPADKKGEKLLKTFERRRD